MRDTLLVDALGIGCLLAVRIVMSRLVADAFAVAFVSRKDMLYKEVKLWTRAIANSHGDTEVTRHSSAT